MLMSLTRRVVSTLLLSIVLTGFLPAVAAADASPTSPTSDATHPVIMQQAASQVGHAKVGSLTPFSPAAPQAAVGGAGAPQREIFGFALASSLSDPTVGYPSWNFSLLTTVAFFGLHVQDDGTFAADSGATVWNSSELTGLVSKAHSTGTKVVLTIIEQDFSSGTPHMCAALSANSTTTTVTNTVAQVKAKGVDGVNVDYEGLNGSCGSTTDPSMARHSFTSFVAKLRAALGTAYYLSVDTYASSAADPAGFFDIPNLAPSVDSFFVMAYDLEYSNYARPPTNCTSFCLGPTAPLAGYYYNDTSTASQYVAAVPASKVILGVPYYGRKACVSTATPNQYPTSGVVADTYLDAVGESSAPQVQPGSYAIHRDANDPAGQERWDTWFNTSLNCTRELYWDDVTSLGHKYDLVNADDLRGVGIWNLNYGGGAPELWNALATKFVTATPWASLGGTLTSGPDASSWGASRTDVFVRGANNGLWQRTWNGTSWGSWISLGGVLTSAPSAVSWGQDRIDVFVRGADNALWHRWFDTAGWHNWESLGGVLTSGPDVSSWGSGRLDVYVRGTDNGLWHRWFDSSGWHNWEALGGVLTSDPGAVSWGSNRLDVFVRGADNALWHRWWDSTGWHTWERLGGILNSGPDASSCAAGHLDAFVVGSDSALYRIGFNGGWGTWQRLGGQWTSDPGAVCPTGTTSVDIFERGPDNALWQSSLAGS
jgi:spore germination protein YaaH